MTITLSPNITQKAPWADLAEREGAVIFTGGGTSSPRNISAMNSTNRTYEAVLHQSFNVSSLCEQVALINTENMSEVEKSLMKAGVLKLSNDNTVGIAWNGTPSGSTQGKLNTDPLESPHSGCVKSTKAQWASNEANGTINVVARLPQDGRDPTSSLAVKLDFFRQNTNLGTLLSDVNFFYNDADHRVYWVSARTATTLTIGTRAYAGGDSLDPADTLWTLTGNPYGTSSNVDCIWAGLQADGVTVKFLFVPWEGALPYSLAAAYYNTLTGVTTWTLPAPTTAGWLRFPRGEYTQLAGDDVANAYANWLPTADGARVIVTGGTVANAAGTGTATGWFIVDTSTMTSVAANVKPNATRSTSFYATAILSHKFGGGGTAMVWNCNQTNNSLFPVSGSDVGVVPNGTFDPDGLFTTSAAAPTWLAPCLSQVTFSGRRTSSNQSFRRLWHKELCRDGKTRIRSIDGILLLSDVVEGAITAVQPLDFDLQAMDDKYQFSVYDTYDLGATPIVKDNTMALDIDCQVWYFSPFDPVPGSAGSIVG